MVALSSVRTVIRRLGRPLLLMLLAGLAALGFSVAQTPWTDAAGTLSVESIAAYNLVVDSNATAPSTYAPNVATVAGRFCNTGDADLTNLYGYIGDFAAGTPGQYPRRDSATFPVGDPFYNTGIYAFTHVGGQLGTTDATRYIGTLAPGECRTIYWHFTYPQCANVWDGSRWVADPPPCNTKPTWGDSVKPDDDLWLTFDIWGTSAEGSNDNASRTMTMRNEISAMANKIKPNPDGRWFNTESDTVEPGGLITSNGILYELGNVRFGFDNDGNYVPDYNAWMQPIGDVGYDPSCFRLIHTSGVLTISRGAGQPDLIVPFDDQDGPHPDYGGPLYFTNLPPDNTGVRGEIFYTFQALNGPCSIGLSPYQEVASGFDNEKFNGDYGLGIPPIGSSEVQVTLDKSSSPNLIPLGGTTTYQIPFANTGSSDFGLPLSTGGLPMVISDTVPNGMQYVGGSATYNLNFTPNNGVTIRYSTDSGATWSETDPGTVSSTAPNNWVILQWWLNDPLPAGSSGNYAQFQATVPTSYSGSPLIENCAEGSLGDGAPFDRACAVTLIQGNNSLGDFVWRDENNNALQDDGAGVGIDNVTVSLYWDKNGDGALDSGDYFISTQTTAGGGAYAFSQLPDGNYLVQVDTSDADLPTGYRITTRETYAVDLDAAGADPNPVSDLTADFGFGPPLQVDKQLLSADPAYEGQLVTFTITLTNTRPGDGSGQPGPCTYTDYADAQETSYSGSGTKAWVNPANIAGDPDGAYATGPFENAGEFIGATTWNLGTHTGAPVIVEVLMPVQLNGTFGSNETLEVNLIDCGANGICEGTSQGTPGGDDALIGTRTFGMTAVSSGLWVIDFSNDRAWTWADFNGSTIVVELVANKWGNNTGVIEVDAVAFRVSNGLTCNDPADIIDPLPLSDTYDPTKLEFVSADPPEDGVAGGTITWDNLGPLYPGQTRQVTVILRALEPPDNDGDGEPDPTTHTNCGDVSGATFLDGSAIPDAQDCVTHNINPAGRIGDTVWNDNGFGGGSSGNGVQDGGEVGIPGVTVYLCSVTPCNSGNAIASDVTDSNGTYLFTGLTDGTYYTAVDTASLPGSTFTQTGDPDEPGGCSVCDSQGTATINNNNGNPADDDDLTQDYGYLIPNTIFGHVWEDNDGDGSWESGENGFTGITVYLDDCGADGICGNGDDGPTVSTTTAAGGYYEFSDLGNGNYRVRVDTTTLPAGATWSNTADPEGDNNSQTNVIAVSGGNIYGPYDLGYYRSGSYSLGDTLYTDWNGDGDQDGGEEGIPNITISLYQDDNGDGVIDPATDGLIATTTTDANGTYTFHNLAAQSYIVVVDEGDPDFPANHNQTQDPDESGTCSTCDGDGSATLGPDDLTVDLGYQPIGTGSIGDLVWRDDNGDGYHQSGEPGLANITVSLYEDSNGNGVIDSGDALVATTPTDSSGNYLFTGLPAGDYLVDVDTTDADLPTDGYGNRYVLSTDNDPHAVTLAAGQEYLDADWGFTTGGIIGDLIWRDDDAQGDQDLNEPGISGVTVRLYNDVNENGTYDPGTDTLYGSEVTDADGYYEFTGLPAGDYVVVVDTTTLPSGYAQTGDPDLTSACSGADCDSESGVTDPGSGYGLPAGQVDRTRDFGYRPPGRLGDTLWINADGDGVRDPDEAGIPYITVRLYTPGGNGTCDGGAGDDVLVATTETDPDGTYAFGDLADGTYCVVGDTSDPDFPSGLVQNYDPDGSNDSQTQAVISGGVVTYMGGNACSNCEYDADFGYIYSGPNSVSGTVFHDDDDDAVQDPAETTTYAGVTIYLWNCGRDNLCGNADDIFAGETTTDANGDYAFSNLPDGRYVVSVNPDAPNLAGLDPTQTSFPTTYREVDLDQAGSNPNPVNAVDQDFGFLSQMDMGDLPSAYGITSLGEDGARHVIPASGAIYLGAGVPDSEPNGQASANVDGDDLSGGDDEDGVVASGLPWTDGPNGGSIDVTVGGCSGTCYLSGWIDWGVDGSLYDAGDRILLAYPVTNGTQTITFDIPAGTPLNTTYYARFRLFETDTAIAALPTGVAYNGEVEDILFDFTPTAVELGSFGATARAGTVVITWETIHEWDNAGFHLYRRPAGSGAYERLNAQIIPSQAPGGGGATYRFEDAGVTAGFTYEYLLEGVDLHGGTTFLSSASTTALYTVYLPLLGR